MTAKPSPDWELAERLYRAGQLTVREVARQAHVSAPGLLKKAKKEGWERDLTEKVRKAVNTKLVNSEVNKDNARKPADRAKERETIEQAAENAVAVVRSHRKDLTAGQSTLALLFAQLQDAATHRDGELDKMAQQVAAEDGMFAAAALARFRKLLSLPTHAGVIRDLSTAMKNFQALERIAWGLNEKDDAPPDYEKQLKELALGKEPPSDG